MLEIFGATLIDGVSTTSLSGPSIWIEGARIKAIAGQDAFGSPPGLVRIDARGHHVIPGLMDANVHLMGDTRLENLIRHEHCFEELIIEAAQITLRNGLTTVFDTWGPRAPLVAARDKIAAGRARGSNIHCAGNIVGLDGPISKDFKARHMGIASPDFEARVNALWAEDVGARLSWESAETVGSAVRAYLARGVDFIKFAASEHRSEEPTAFLVFSDRAQRAIVAAARDAGKTVQAHVSSLEALRAAVAAGVDIVQHANITGSVPIPAMLLDELAASPCAFTIFPFTRRRFERILAAGTPLARQYFGASDENVRRLIRCGVPLLLATDAGLKAKDVASDPAIANSWVAAGEDNLAALGEGHFHWMRAMEEKGAARMDIIRSATIRIATAYGLGDRVGSIEKGKVADLVILAADPLSSIDNVRHIARVIQGGVDVALPTLPDVKILS